MSGIGRAVWYIQWVALIATPIWWATASTFTGGGWGTVIAELLAVPTFVLMLIAPIVGVANQRLRTAQVMPKTYSVITVVQWALGCLWPLTIPMAGDTVSTGVSALGAIGIPETVVSVINVVSFLGFSGLMVVGLITLFSTIRTVPDAGDAVTAGPGAPAGPVAS